MSVQEAAEKVAEAEAAGREAAQENARLQDHIHDLETRKRAPLYQKRQEEELRAALEKGAEADARAQDAETRAKEAKVTRGLCAACAAMCRLRAGSNPGAACADVILCMTRIKTFRPAKDAWLGVGFPASTHVDLRSSEGSCILGVLAG